MNNTEQLDEELIGLLTAISITSKRLANKLIKLTQASQSQKGSRLNGQNERT